MRLRNSFFFLVLTLLSISLSAQQGITGKVFDEEGRALSGASIQVKGFIVGAIADESGKFILKLPNNAEFLLIRFPGYQEHQLKITEQREYRISLSPVAYFMEEVVVTGVGSATPTTKIGFDITRVDNSQLKEVPGINVLSALQGKVAGVTILAGSGLPGSNPSIRIRGANNLQGFPSSPLFIMDGILLQDPTNLADISSEDIESIEIIKGAAATSLYGSRAGGGVVQILTKRGSQEEGKTLIKVRNEWGRSSLARKVEITRHHPFAFNPDGSVNYWEFDADQIADNEYPQIFDHQGQFYEPGNFMTNSISIASRKGGTNYYLSLQNTQQDGTVFLLDGYRRQNIRANIDHQISERLKLSFSNAYAQSRRDDPSTVGFNSAFDNILFVDPSLDLFQKNLDGTNYLWNVCEQGQSNCINPLYDLDNTDKLEESERYSGSLGLQLSLTSFLDLEASYALDRRVREQDIFVDKGFLANPFIADGYLERSSSKRTYKTYTSKLNFHGQVGGIKLKSQAALIYEDDEVRSFGLMALDFRFRGIRTLNNAGLAPNGINRKDSRSTDFEIKTLNYYLTSTIDWQDKLILDGLVRYDGSSLFGSNNQWNTFFRTSLAYRLSEDISIPGVQELKLRASYGTSGNRPRFEYRFETLASDGSKSTLGNEDLRSSLRKELEVGMDAWIWNRLNLSLTYSQSYLSDLFFNVPLPAAAGGFLSQWKNIDSEMKAVSFEATLGINLIKSRDFELSMNVTFDGFRQTITKFDFPDLINGGVFLIREGLSFGTIYTPKVARRESDLFPEQRNTGPFVENQEGLLVRANQLGTTTESPIFVQEDNGNSQFITGNFLPDFNMGLAINLRWKGLQFYSLLNWKQGGDLLNKSRQFPYRDLLHGDIDQSAKPLEDRKPAGYYFALYNRNRIHDYFLEDGTYLKFREMALSYTFDTANWPSLSSVLKGMKISIVGRNLFTITNYTGYDPEVAWYDDQFDATVSPFDAFGYPNFRTLSGAIELTF